MNKYRWCRSNKWLAIAVYLLTVASCKPITDIDQSNNHYTAQTTYQKLKPQYPFITIANSAVPENVNELKNITYVRYGRRALQLDLYLPSRPNSSLAPAVVLVHGGGWSSGYRTNLTPLAIALAAKGYVAATISYRLSPEAKYPAAIYDVKAAIRWLRKNADKYQLDPQKIAVGGGSAGGQVANLVGVTNKLARFDPQSEYDKASSAVQAILVIDGLSDFTDPAALKYEDDPRKSPSAAGAWFGGRYNEVPNIWREASPIYYVNANTPPVLYINSSQIRFSVGYKEMSKKLKQEGVAYKIIQIPNSPHSFWLFDPWLQATADAIVEFLDQQFLRLSTSNINLH